MESRKIEVSVRHYASLKELATSDQRLVAAAQQACMSAYAPYSNFRVGAAVLLNDGEIMSASNQESEVFPSGMCAERSLLYYVQSHLQGREIVAMALISDPGVRECTPCGACRQVMVDTQKRQRVPFRVLMCSATSATVVDSAEDLLPFTFEL